MFCWGKLKNTSSGEECLIFSHQNFPKWVCKCPVFPQSENSGSLQLKDFLGKFDAECFCTEQSNALLLCVHEFLSGRFLQCLNSASPLLKIYSLIQINASKEIERNRPLSMNDISLVLGQIILTTTTTT